MCAVLPRRGHQQSQLIAAERHVRHIGGERDAGGDWWRGGRVPVRGGQIGQTDGWGGGGRGEVRTGYRAITGQLWVWCLVFFFKTELIVIIFKLQEAPTATIYKQVTVKREVMTSHLSQFFPGRQRAGHICYKQPKRSCVLQRMQVFHQMRLISAAEIGNPEKESTIKSSVQDDGVNT